MPTQLELPFPDTADIFRLSVIRDDEVLHTFADNSSFDDLLEVREVLVAWWPKDIGHDGEVYSGVSWEEGAKPTGWYGIEPETNVIWCIRIEPVPSSKDN